MTSSKNVFAGAVATNAESFEARDWLLFGGISMVWGASFLLIAEALEALTPSMVTLGRVGLGAAALWLVRALAGTGERIDPADRGRVALLAVLWVALPFTLYPIAQQWINSAVAGLLNGATPILVTLVSVVFIRVLPRPLQVAGLAVGFAGVLAISIGSAGAGASQTRGVLLALGATCCYGFAINLAGPLQSRYGAVTLMSSVLGIATVLVVPAALVDLGDNRPALGPGVAVTFLGVVGTGLAYWMMSALVGRVGSIRASFITYLIPVVSLVLGVTIRGDRVTALALAGTPAVIAGALLAGPSRLRVPGDRNR